jgi:hypothetical protein
VWDLARTPAIAVVVSALVVGSGLLVVPIAPLSAHATGSILLATRTLSKDPGASPPGAGPSPAPSGSLLEPDPAANLRSGGHHPLGATYVPVYFIQAGLVLGTEWSVVLTNVGTVYSNGTNASLSLTPGEYNWTAGNVEGYRSSAGGSFEVADAAIWVTVNYYGILFTTYPVTFRSPEIPPGVVWYVNLKNGAVASTANSTLTFYEVNTSIGWYIGPAAHLTASPASGVLQVNGTPSEQTIHWLIDPGYYEVLFNETGLPAGFNWSVTLDGNTTHAFASPIGFIVTNGSYPFSDYAPSGFAGHPATGTASVQGSETEFLIVFGPKLIETFGITFLSEGVPQRATWSVTLAGLTLIASGPGVGMEFYVPNGTYSYLVRSPFGFMSSPSNGSIRVNGSAPSTIFLVFSHAPVPGYAVEFLESGLPLGTPWAVTWGEGTYHVSTNRTVAFSTINGSYFWWITTNSTFSASPSSGEVNVSGPLPGPFLIRFAPPPTRFAVRFVEHGLPNDTLWSVAIVGGATHPSENTTIELAEPNGTFTFLVGNLSGMNATPWEGSFDVKAGPVEIDIGWHKVTPPFLGSADFWLLVTLSSATTIAAISLLWHYRRPRLPFTRWTARRLLTEEFRH